MAEKLLKIEVPWEGGVNTLGSAEPVLGAAYYTTTVKLDSIMIPQAYLDRGNATHPGWMHDIAVLTINHQVPNNIVNWGTFPAFPGTRAAGGKPSSDRNASSVYPLVRHKEAPHCVACILTTFGWVI